MKAFRLTLLSFTAAVLFTACSPTPEEARIYNDELIALENPLSQTEENFIDMLSSEKSTADLKKAYDELVKQSDEAVSGIEKIGAFDNNTSFRDAAEEYFRTIQAIVKNEYKSLVELASKNPEEITEEDSKKYEELLDGVQSKTDKVLSKIQAEQAAFAAKFKFTIEDVEAAKQ
ncbi:MAG TPA: hypothetical protein VF868_10370 [Bacteroidia bacterium]|jgi:hypothetical protein